MEQTLKKESYALSGFELAKLIYQQNISKTFDLKMSSFAVLTALTHHYNQEKRLVFPSIRLLCERLNCAKSTVILAIDELIAKGLILKIKKGKHNAYSFTALMLNSLGLNRSDSNTDRSEIHTNNRTEIHTLTNNPNQKKEKTFSSKNLSEFQMRYIDVFQKLSEKELTEYKLLQGFDKEPWLIGKRRGFAEKKKSAEQRELYKEYEENASCPLDWSKEEQLEYLKGLPPILKNSYFAREIKAKWNIE